EHADWPGRQAEPRAPAGSPFTEAMAALRRVARPGTLVAILSDFTDFSRAAPSYLAGVARHSEVLAVLVSDRLERQSPPPGRYRVLSGATELSIETYARAARDDYARRFIRRRETVEAFCRRYGAHLLPLSTDEDPVAVLKEALGRRPRPALTRA